MKRLLIALALSISALGLRGEITLDECIRLAEGNYPEIKRYRIADEICKIELSDINKGWLPRIGVYAQGTAQNVVPAFPTALSGVMDQLGTQVRGLGKLQYRAGADITQTIWDGGISKARREIIESKAEISKKTIEVDVYAIKGKTENLYFGILLLEARAEMLRNSISILESNIEKLTSMVRNGTAMQSDLDMADAQRLFTEQSVKETASDIKGFRGMLSILTGKDLSNEELAIPEAEVPAVRNPDRPELRLFEARLRMNELLRRMVRAEKMPKISFFLQGYYGYPGIDYFKAMMTREMSFNIVGGVKATWNIDSFYTQKNSLNKLALSDTEIENDEEIFLFNNSLQVKRDSETIEGIQNVMNEDSRIIELRKSVRNAAESQLRNGIIDITALLTKINDETQARLAAAYHKIQYIQAVYNLKNSLNR